MRLEQEGLVASQWHHGATVVDFSREDIVELATLRGALEQLAVTEAIRSATADDFASLSQIVEQMRSVHANSDDASLVRLDIEFHDAVYRAAHHDRLYAAWTTIRSQVTLALLRRRIVNPDYSGLVVREHSALAATLGRGDPEQAKAEIAAHIDGAYSRLLAAFDNSSRVAQPGFPTVLG